MSDKKRKKKRQSIFSVYVSRVALYIAIALVFTVSAIIIAMPKASEYVHLVEESFPISIADIEPSDELVEFRKAGYGAKLGTIRSQDFGLNCELYYGANRASMRYGAGVSGKNSQTSIFNDYTYICGYGESYFAPLHFAKAGDIITVSTSDFDVDYKVLEASYVEKGKASYNGKSDDIIVLCAKQSDFSKHSGEDFCVIATAVRSAIS